MIELCELRNYGTTVSGKKLKCSNNLQNHHLINRGKYSKNKRVKKYIDDNPQIFLTKVCDVHNAQTKLADSKAARKILLRRKVELFGLPYTRTMVNGIPWKVPHHELSYAGIMSFPLPK